MRRDWLIATGLAALVLAVYWPVRSHDFIAYDDPEFVIENTQVQSGLNWATLTYAFTQPLVGNWHPLTTLSHAADCEFFGLNPGPPHLVNAVLHSLNAALLFLLLRRLTRAEIAPYAGTTARQGTPVVSTRLGSVWVCLLAACLFALHPLRVESVAWLAERKDLLSAFFFLLSLWMYAGYARGVEAGDTFASALTPGRGIRCMPRSRMFYGLSLLCFAFALMSKPMVVTLPFVLLLLDLWPLGSLGVPVPKARFSNVARLVIEKIPFLLLSAATCWITLKVQQGAGATQVLHGITWSERLGNALTSYVRYLGKMFWPSDLAIVYPHPARHYYLNDQWPAWQVLAAGLLLVMISLFCLIQIRKRPYLAVGWFWYLGMLIPVIGIVQVGEQAMADRYTYLPEIGIVVALVFWLADALGHAVVPVGPSQADSSRAELPAPVRVSASVVEWSGMTGAVLLMLLLIGLTRQQLAYWTDTVNLFEHAIAVTPDNPSAQFAVGVGLEKAGEVRRAAVRYRVAVAIDPNYTKAYYNLGQILRKTSCWRPAADAYLAAARLNPSDSAIRLNLASVLSRVGRFQEAVTHFDKALQLDANSIEGLNNLAWLLATCPEAGVRDGPRAVQLAERAASLTDSKAPVLLGTLAAAYAEAGRFLDAVATAQRAAARAAETGDSDTAAKNRELLQLYLAGKPYRQVE